MVIGSVKPPCSVPRWNSIDLALPLYFQLAWPICTFLFTLHDGSSNFDRTGCCICKFAGVDSISIDRKANKLTVMVIGDGIDAVDFVTELRTFCHAEIMSVGPARNEKKIEPKKEEQKKKEGQMSKDEDQVKKDENAFAELN
ncbi:hypothetical protein H0E87_027694, partial [Populus deltoides]